MCEKFEIRFGWLMIKDKAPSFRVTETTSGWFTPQTTSKNYIETSQSSKQQQSQSSHHNLSSRFIQLHTLPPQQQNLINVPNQVLTTNTRCLDSSSNEGTSSKPNAPSSSNDRETQSKGNSEVSISIGWEMGEYLWPSSVTVIWHTVWHFGDCVLCVWFG